jgi:hypothetical protein
MVPSLTNIRFRKYGRNTARELVNKNFLSNSAAILPVFEQFRGNSPAIAKSRSEPCVIIRLIRNVGFFNNIKDMRRLINALLYFGLLATGNCKTKGTPADIQAAINSAAPGSTVEIANGTYTWTSGITVDKAIILKGQSKGGVRIVCTGMSGNVITATEPSAGNLEIADLDFQFSTASGHYVYALQVHPRSPRGTGRVLLHDCVFTTNYAYALEWDTNGGGLSGISFVPRSFGSSWQSLATFGAKDQEGLAGLGGGIGSQGYITLYDMGT